MNFMIFYEMKSADYKLKLSHIIKISINIPIYLTHNIKKIVI